MQTKLALSIDLSGVPKIYAYGQLFRVEETAT